MIIKFDTCSDCHHNQVCGHKGAAKTIEKELGALIPDDLKSIFKVDLVCYHSSIKKHVNVLSFGGGSEGEGASRLSQSQGGAY